LTVAAAASGLLNWEAGVLYAILFLWQFPHFYAIAWMYRDDYAKAGILMLPVVEPSNESTARRIVWFSLVLIPISLLPKYFDMVGYYYVCGAVAVGLYFLYAGLRASFDRTLAHARCRSRAWFISRCFMASWCRRQSLLARRPLRCSADAFQTHAAFMEWFRISPLIKLALDLTARL
jgi:heme O synthase-like polyprenyltransferase